MELELKHIAPYSPYELKVIITYYQEKGVMDLEKLSKYKCWLSNGGSIHLWQEQHINKIKPILHPLSDLTKEIEHNGEKFVPLIRLKNEWETLYLRGINLEMYIDDRFESELKYFPYDLVQKLLEWHFDVFELIDKNLAIDINTLKFFLRVN